MAWKEAMMVFSNFFEFFGFFLEFSITGHVGTHRNDFFYFHSFSAFPILFWLQKKLWWCFLIFWIFFAIFFEFSITGRLGTHQIDFLFSFLSFSAFSNLFFLEKKLWWCSLIFRIFLLFFFIFYYGSARNTSERFF